MWHAAALVGPIAAFPATGSALMPQSCKGKWLVSVAGLVRLGYAISQAGDAGRP